MNKKVETAMLAVNPRIRIPESEIELTYARSAGPGGQNVNKVSSKAVLRWCAARSTALPDDVRARFLRRYHRRITGKGDLVLTSQRYRDRARNVADVRAKLVEMVASVATAPRKRKPTRPTQASVARRIKSKQARSRKKQLRRAVGGED